MAHLGTVRRAIDVVSFSVVSFDVWLRCRRSNEPEPGVATVYVTGARDAVPLHPLRLAVAWQRGNLADERWLTTYDTRLRLLQDRLRVPLTLPPLSMRPTLTDASTAYLECHTGAQTIEAPVVSPRILIYEDVDESGDLNPDLPYAPGIDRVWGISERAVFPIVAFSDLDQVLSSLPMEGAECLRSVTNGSYSSFFQGRYYSGQLMPSGSPISTYIHLSATQYARVLMGCALTNERGLATVDQVRDESEQRWVDDAIAGDPCAESAGTCTRGQAASFVLPDIVANLDPGSHQNTECYVFGNLDALLVAEYRLVCEGCLCHWNGVHKTWIVDSSRPPKAWPCGSRVKYCATPTDSLWKVPNTCSPVVERPE